MIALGGIAGLLLALGIWLVATGMLPVQRPDRDGEPTWRDRWPGKVNRRLVAAMVAGLLVGIVTRWPAAAMLAALFAYATPALLGLGRAEANAQATLAAIASWVDTLRGEIRSYAGIEQAIRGTAGLAKEPIADQVHALAQALERGVRLRVAINAFRRDVAHPAADQAGIALVKAASTHTGNLAEQLRDLADSVREQAAAQERIFTSQTEARTSARLVIFIVAAVGAGLYLFNRAMLPLGSVLGQLVLAAVSLMWTAAGLWLHRLATTPPAPHVFKTHDEVAT